MSSSQASIGITGSAWETASPRSSKFGGNTVSGEVIELHATDNNGATIVDDATGEETEVVCEWCAQIPTFRSRETPPAPRAALMSWK